MNRLYPQTIERTFNRGTFARTRTYDWVSGMTKAVTYWAHFLPDFLIPVPLPIGPFCPALVAASFSFFASSCCFFLNSRSASSRSLVSFLADLRGFSFPPWRPDILTT
ncbi:hypothetical protein PENTCL1PPCAC_17959, partial [Pristionchus entomophagus]